MLMNRSTDSTTMIGGSRIFFRNHGNSHDDQLHTSGEFVARKPDDRYTANWVRNETSSAGIRVPISNGINLSTQFNLDYNNELAIGKKNR